MGVFFGQPHGRAGGIQYGIELSPDCRWIDRDAEAIPVQGICGCNADARCAASRIQDAVNDGRDECSHWDLIGVRRRKQSASAETLERCYLVWRHPCPDLYPVGRVGAPHCNCLSCSSGILRQ